MQKTKSIKVSEPVHRLVKIAAIKGGQSVQEVAERAIKNGLSKGGVK